MGYVKDIATFQRANNASGVLTFTFSITATPVSANDLILSMNSNVVITSITDSKGNTWVESLHTTGGGAVPAQWLCQQDVAPLVVGDTITLHSSSNMFGIAGRIGEFSGLSATPLDKTASGVFATATTSRSAGTTATLAQANELVVATFGLNGAETSFAPDTGSGYSAPTTPYVNNSTNNRSVESEYKIASSTAAVSPTATGGATLQGAGVVCTYKLASTGNIIPATTVSATSTVTGKVVTRHKIGGAVSATSTVGGTVQKPGQTQIPSTYGVGTYGVAVFGGTTPVPTGIRGQVFATSVVSGGLSRLQASGGGGGIYTPPYTPPTPPPTPSLGTFGPFAEAVYDLLNGDNLG